MTTPNRRYPYVLLSIALGALTFTQLGSFLGSGQIVGFLPAAHAQEFTDEDVTNYAAAVVEIEAQREEAYAKASDILTAASGNDESILETPLSCGAAKLSDMPDIPRPDRVDLQAILIEFCEAARLTAESNNLTPKRFNSITAAHKADPDVAERIQTAISEL